MPNSSSSLSIDSTFFSIFTLLSFFKYILIDPPCVSIFSALNILIFNCLKKFTSEVKDQ